MYHSDVFCLLFFSSNLALPYFCESIVKTMKFIKTLKFLSKHSKWIENIERELLNNKTFTYPYFVLFFSTLFNNPIQTIAKL